MSLKFKSLIGAGLGGGAGLGYSLLMQAIGSNCISCEYPAIPIAMGAAIGLFFVWSRS